MTPQRIREIAAMTGPKGDGKSPLTVEQALRLAVNERIEECARIADRQLGEPAAHETGEPVGVAEEIRSLALSA